MAYHTREIKKGTFGEITKVIEEYEEFLDNNNSEILKICELTDYYGAVKGYINKYNLIGDDFYEQLSVYDMKMDINYNLMIFDTIHNRLISYSLDNNVTDRQYYELFKSLFNIIHNIALSYNLNLDEVKRFSEMTSSAFIEGKRK